MLSVPDGEDDEEDVSDGLNLSCPEVEKNMNNTVGVANERMG